MQVNSIQASPKFGMALKITGEARPALEQMSKTELQKIKAIGKELAGHKHVDVILTDGAKPVVTNYANAYKDIFRVVKRPQDEYIDVLTHWAGKDNFSYKNGDEYKKVCRLRSNEDALKVYEKINSSTSDIEKAAEFAKAIEENQNIHEAEAMALKAKLDEQKQLTEELFNEFKA